jgi:hypothetical protein
MFKSIKKLFNFKSKSALSQTTELAVIITIMSTLVTGGFYTAKVLINNSKMNAIMQDYTTLRDSFITFTTIYGCVPGLCSATDLSASELDAANQTGCAGVVPSTAVTSYGISAPAVRTCAFLQMQSGGIFVGKTITKTISGQTTTNVIGSDLPGSSLKASVAWDLRSIFRPYVGSTLTNGSVALPLEATTNLAAGQIYHTFILRSVDTAGTSIDASLIGSNVIFSSVSPNFASKLKGKFDSPSAPFSGFIMAGKNPSAAALASGCWGRAITATASTALSTSSTAGTIIGATYTPATTSADTFIASDDSGTNGCILAFVFQASA